MGKLLDLLRNKHGYVVCLTEDDQVEVKDLRQEHYESVLNNKNAIYKELKEEQNSFPNSVKTEDFRNNTDSQELLKNGFCFVCSNQVELVKSSGIPGFYEYTCLECGFTETIREVYVDKRIQ